MIDLGAGGTKQPWEIWGGVNCEKGIGKTPVGEAPFEQGLRVCRLKQHDQRFRAQAIQGWDVIKDGDE
jgi:hypothetical protein